MSTFRTLSQTAALLAECVDLTRPVHALTMTGRTMCGTDARTHVTSAYGTDVTCESCRAEWSPVTRARIDALRADLDAHPVA